MPVTFGSFHPTYHMRLASFQKIDQFGNAVNASIDRVTGYQPSSEDITRH